MHFVRHAQVREHADRRDHGRGARHVDFMSSIAFDGLSDSHRIERHPLPTSATFFFEGVLPWTIGQVNEARLFFGACETARNMPMPRFSHSLGRGVDLEAVLLGDRCATSAFLRRHLAAAR